MGNHTIQLGNKGPAVFRIGLGCMGMSGLYGPADEPTSIRTIQHAIDRGITLIDTGDFYGMGHNERLIQKALGGRRDKVQLSVKFGALRGPGGDWLGVDGRPAAVKTFAAYSLDRLGVEAIDVYRPARLDPSVPIEDTVGAIGDLIDAGYVRHVGLSEVGADTIRRAASVRPIADLQIEYSLASRGPEAKVFPALAEVGASATLYGVFSRGLLTGSKPSASPGDFRRYLPRFQGDAAAANERVTTELAAFAKRVERSTAQLAIGWVLARQPSSCRSSAPRPSSTSTMRWRPSSARSRTTKSRRSNASSRREPSWATATPRHTWRTSTANADDAASAASLRSRPASLLLLQGR